jgi:tRNA (cytidine/uridine-2'-O-)-methyltransferase
MRIALFQPDIAANTGTILRLGACMGVAVDIIEPCGFPMSDRALRRAGMDYLDRVEMRQHASWDAFNTQRTGRLILLTVEATAPYTQFEFENSDTLLLGRETAGVPKGIHALADARLCIPMVEGERSLNVALACAMVLGEALRQTGQFKGKLL